MDIIDKDSASAVGDAISAGVNLASADLFEKMAEKVADTPGLAKKVNAVFLWNINKNKAQAAQWSKFFVSLKTHFTILMLSSLPSSSFQSCHYLLIHLSISVGLFQ